MTAPEVIAVRYGTLETTRRESYYNYEAYGERDAPQRMDYFFWLIRGASATVLVDTGFDPAVGVRRGRTCLVEPLAALRQLDVEPESITNVIVTHCHYDHIGNLAAFPNAVVTMQRKEFEFWTSGSASHQQFARLAEAKEIDDVLAVERDGRLHQIDGDAEMAPGIRLQHVGGHSPGQQIIHVETAGRTVVLASDALHFYEEMERDMPFVAFCDLLEMYEAYDTLREFERRDATSIVAGHDPVVADRFARMESLGDGVAVQLA